MKTGRKPKPTALKAIAGTDRADRAPKNPVVIPLIDHAAAPEWLTHPEALAEWRRVASLLTSARVLSDVDLTALAHYCLLHGHCVDAYVEGEAPPATRLAQMRALAAEFGLTPASRMRIQPTAPPQRENPFARNGRRV